MDVNVKKVGKTSLTSSYWKLTFTGLGLQFSSAVSLQNINVTCFNVYSIGPIKWIQHTKIYVMNLIPYITNKLDALFIIQFVCSLVYDMMAFFRSKLCKSATAY